MPDERSKLISKIIRKNTLASDEEVEKCLRIVQEEREKGTNTHLIDVLLHLKILDKRQAKAILNAAEQTEQIQYISAKISGYQFLCELGHGTAGTVYLAKQLNIGREVAVKILDEQMAENPIFIRNFNREAKSAAKLNHPNVIQAIDVGETDGIHYFVMEYVNGESLFTVLKREKVIEEARVLHVGLQMARALSHANHHNVIHRDIKPANIMLSSDGRAKLCDLGLARMAGSPSQTATKSGSAGTPAYMSPEQAKGKSDLDIRTDLFSLGISLYHMVTGALPFSSDNLVGMLKAIIKCDVKPMREVRPEVSSSTEEIILKLLKQDREDRPDDPSLLEEWIEDALEELPQSAPLALLTPSGPIILPPAGITRTSGFLVPTITITTGHDAGRSIVISRTPLIFGRHSSADIRVKDRWISRQQFEISRNGETYRIRSLSDSNPTQLNNEEIKEADLKSGDEITILQTVFRFENEPHP